MPGFTLDGLLRCQLPRGSLLPAAVGAQDVVALRQEAAAHQGHGALHAGEALAVPLPLLKGDVLGSRQTWRRAPRLVLSEVNRFTRLVGVTPLESRAARRLTGYGLGAAHTLLGVQVAVALQAVGVVLPGGEALARQLLPAADAQEALAVPRLLLVGHSTRRDGLGEMKLGGGG